MKIQLVILGLVILLVCMVLSGCEQESNTLNPEKSKFVGTWQRTTQFGTITIIFFSNGTYAYGAIPLNGTWDLKDGKLVSVPSGGVSITQDYTFSNNDNTLYFAPSEGFSTGNYTKQ
jgi:hypothetical protein